ncbi:AI-2E family transporter [Solicola sp. PLA-1-18]|uniref:AI-2E family transporter n=1 Tax=Solicola sp. PLA-1-18 TaxID=3380532 RepID=UPI003B806433
MAPQDDDAGASRDRLLPTREQVVGQGVAWSARWAGRWIVIALGVVVLCLVVQRVWSILLPVVLGLIVATLLEPPARLLQRRLNAPAALAAGVVVLGAVLVVGLVFTFLASTIVEQVAQVVASAADGLDEVARLMQNAGIEVSQGQIDTAIGAVQDRLQSSASTIAGGVLVGVGAVTSALVNVVLTLVLAFFFVKDGRRFVPWLATAAGPSAGPHLAEVLHRSWRALGEFIRTQALVGLIDAVLIGAGLFFVGVPLVLPLAVLTFIAAFAPIVGAITVGVLAVLVALVSNGWVAALIIAGVVLLVQQLEGNVLLPFLQGRSLGLHAVVVLLAVVLGSTLFGVAGAFLSVPFTAVAAVIVRYLNEVIEERAGRTEAVGEPPVEIHPDPDA